MSYEGTKQNQFASNLTLPTTAMRSGDFSGAGVLIYDPLTGNADGTGRTPFAGNIVPANRIAPASATLTEGKIKLTLQGEAYNLTNTVVFANPGGSCCWMTTATTGTINYNGFGVISATQSTPRYLVVAGYVRF